MYKTGQAIGEDGDGEDSEPDEGKQGVDDSMAPESFTMTKDTPSIPFLPSQSSSLVDSAIASPLSKPTSPAVAASQTAVSVLIPATDVFLHGKPSTLSSNFYPSITLA
jgi:hypothetical protein